VFHIFLGLDPDENADLQNERMLFGQWSGKNFQIQSDYDKHMMRYLMRDNLFMAFKDGSRWISSVRGSSDDA